MRQADILVGHDYTLSDDTYSENPRLRVLATPAFGRVRVKVIEADPDKTYRAYTQGSEVEVSTRILHQTWDAWVAGADDRAAAQQANERRWEQQRRAREDARRDQVALDPNRQLPAHYDNQDDYAARGPFGDRRTRPHELVARALQPFADLMTHWPASLRRDILAAGADPGSQTYARGSVGAAMAPAVDVLRRACDADSPDEGLRPGMLDDAFGAFVQALEAEADTAGTRLAQPWAPALTTPDAALPQQGWLQVRVAHTETGSALHSPTCHTLRHTRTGPFTSYPRWQVTIAGDAARCGWCGGPDLTNAPEVAHVAPAAAVWDARGRTHIEPWQRVAFAQLVGATLVEGATAGQQPGGKADRVLAKLASRPLERQEAYRVSNWLADDRWDEVDETASRLAAQRLNLAFKALPKEQRPGQVPSDVTADAVQTHLRTLREHGPFLAPYPLLFGCPNSR